MSSYVRFLCALVLAQCISCPTLFAQESGGDTEKSLIKYPVDTAILELTLTDDDTGKPIAGASVQPYALRCDEDSGSHYGWPTYNVGKPRVVVTDADGVAKIEYPVRFGTAPDWLTTNEISLNVAHPSYIPTTIHLDPLAGRAANQLTMGEEVAFSATTPEGEAVEELGIVMAGPGQNAKWKLNDGMFRSRAVPNGRWQALLVALRDDGNHLFSSVLPVRLAKGRKVNIRNLKLRPGLRLTGSLADNVPRPIKDGKVIAWCLPKPMGRTFGDENPSLYWSDEAEIEKDGTFEFKSLPRGGKIQLIAICRGWVIANVDEGFDAPAPSRVRGILADADSLPDDNQQLTITLGMEPTSDIEVTVLKPDGTPLQAARVSIWPNQILHLAGSQVVGKSTRSPEIVRAQFSDKSAADVWLAASNRPAHSRYSSVTDESGRVLLRDAPALGDLEVGINHDNYIAPKSNEQFGRINRNARVSLTAGETSQLEIKMENRPK